MQVKDLKRGMIVRETHSRHTPIVCQVMEDAWVDYDRSDGGSRYYRATAVNLATNQRIDYGGMDSAAGAAYGPKLEFIGWMRGS